MVHQLSGGAWGVVIRRPLGAASAHAAADDAALPADRSSACTTCTIWTHADVVAHDEVLQHKALYLNVPFFLVRAAVYFAVWNALSRTS